MALIKTSIVGRAPAFSDSCVNFAFV